MVPAQLFPINKWIHNSDRGYIAPLGHSILKNPAITLSTMHAALRRAGMPVYANRKEKAYFVSHWISASPNRSRESFLAL
jgi:hypothetical protein